MTERHAHKRAVRQAFERAAETYDSAAAVQREACARLGAFAAPFAARLAARLAVPLDAPFDTALAADIGRPLGVAVDAGCGTGYGLAEMAALCPGLPRIGLDLAPAMLVRARRRAAAGAPGDELPVVCGDLEHLPLATASVAFLWSSLALQWCAPEIALGEIGRVLQPGGLAVIATLGPDTLHELEAAFAAIDAAAHRIAFHSAQAWAEHGRAARLTPLAVAQVRLHARAPDLRRLLRDIKTIGASTVGGGRRRTPLGREAWRRLEQRYEAHRGADGLLHATYDLILLALRKPDDCHPARP
jgi:malonyl-CoA O-methyltransferase